MSKRILIASLFLGMFCLPLFAAEQSQQDQEESISITTYYPSPYGSYNELSTNKMKIGTNYSGSAVTAINNGLIVEGNIGIGTDSPDAELEVAGQIKITGGSPSAGRVLTSDAAGLAHWQTPSVDSGVLRGHAACATCPGLSTPGPCSELVYPVICTGSCPGGVSISCAEGGVLVQTGVAVIPGQTVRWYSCAY